MYEISASRVPIFNITQLLQTTGVNHRCKPQVFDLIITIIIVLIFQDFGALAIANRTVYYNTLFANYFIPVFIKAAHI